VILKTWFWFGSDDCGEGEDEDEEMVVVNAAFAAMFLLRSDETHGFKMQALKSLCSLYCLN